MAASLDGKNLNPVIVDKPSMKIEQLEADRFR